MSDIMKFMLDMADLAGTNAERRVASVCDAKPSQQPFNQHKDKYTESQLKYIQEQT